MPDQLSALYENLLEGSYDCVDRVILKAYFGMGQTGGGLRVWWRALHGSDEQLGRQPSDAHGRTLQPASAGLGKGQQHPSDVLLARGRQTQDAGATSRHARNHSFSRNYPYLFRSQSAHHCDDVHA